MARPLGPCLAFGPFRLYPGARVLERDGTRLALGSRALDLLVVLASRAGEVVGHRELEQEVWRNLVVASSNLRVQMAALRKALGDAEDAPRYIASVPGRGYCFVAPIARIDADEHAGAAPAQPPAPRHNLPIALTSFIGREREIRQVEELLASTRLLTLTGAGGCGKTRLALQAGEAVLGEFEHGLRLVELAPLGDASLVAQTVANTLDVAPARHATLEDAIAEQLGSKRMLLVLDNAEHLVESCARLADALLRRCGGLKLLVTSREPLGVNGERSYRVPSLSLPADDASALESEAVRLFVERVRLHRPEFEPTPSHGAALVSICRRLDGIALAIELAASRVRSLTLKELDAHLDDRFGLLTGGDRTAPARHRTLQSLMDWSYDLLSVEEKTMLRRLAVFAGGFTVEAVEAVCAGGAIERGQVLDLLTALADKSLLSVHARDDATRFGMLETMRHYAWDRLRDSGEEQALRERHLAHFIALAEQLDAAQDDAQRAARLRRMDVEHDNLRAALAWCEGSPARAVQGLRLAGHLDWFWRMRGHYGEGRGWIERLLAVAPPDGQTLEYAVALHTAGVLVHQVSGSYGEELLLASLALFERLGDRPRMTRALGNLGNQALLKDDLPLARERYERALAIARELEDHRGIALGLHCLSYVVEAAGDLDRAIALLEEGLPIARTLGSWSPAPMLADLGMLKHRKGDLQGARKDLTEAVEAQRAFGNRAGIAMNLVMLGEVLFDLADVAQARARLDEALTILETVCDQRAINNALVLAAQLCEDGAGPGAVARLLGRADRLREEHPGAGMDKFEPPRRKGLLTRARAATEAAAFDAYRDEGRGMTLEQVLAYARQVGCS